MIFSASSALTATTLNSYLIGLSLMPCMTSLILTPSSKQTKTLPMKRPLALSMLMRMFLVRPYWLKISRMSLQEKLRFTFYTYRQENCFSQSKERMLLRCYWARCQFIAAYAYKDFIFQMRDSSAAAYYFCCAMRAQTYSQLMYMMYLIFEFPIRSISLFSKLSGRRGSSLLS